MLRLSLVLIALWLGVSRVDAQERVPKRPKLPAGADSSDPLAHYRHALSVIDEDPRAAEAALYWAMRIAPSWPEAMYARRIAVLRSEEQRFIRYMRGDARARRDLRWADSLLYRSRLLDPFIFQDLDRGLLRHYLRSVTLDDLRRRGVVNVATAQLQDEIERYIDDLLRSPESIGLRAWMAFSNREMEDALRLYASLLGKKPNPDVREDRATIFYLTQRYDSAAGELERAIAEFAERDRKQEISLYRPKALLYHKLGVTRAKQAHLESAKSAFAKALEEDLSFYPAHITLANIALTAGDTATAVQELELAVQLGPNEVAPYMRFVELLMNIGRDTDALAPLKTVIQREPYYAAPRLRLARLLEKQGDKAGAIEQYNAFLHVAARGDGGREEARQRIAALGGAPGGRF